MTPAAFAAQMQFLAKNGYHVLPLARIDEFLAGRTPLPKKSVVITIDDGYRSTFDIAFPILKQHGFPATVFLYSDFVGAGDALTWAQMKEMAASGLVDIQPHSKTHANLTLRLADETDARYRERVRREVDTPIALIKERLSLPSTSFAYPYGDVNEIVVDLLARQGTQMGVTVTPGGNGFFAYPYMLRRNHGVRQRGSRRVQGEAQHVFVRTRGQVGAGRMRARGLLLPCCLALLAACAEAPPRPRRPAEVAKASPTDAAIASAIAAHRQQAERDAAAGRSAAAAREWQILALLAPGRRAVPRATARRRARRSRKAFANSCRSANAALRSGDAERASVAMLKVLSLDPDNAEAMKALRDIDRQKFSRIQNNRAARAGQACDCRRRPRPRPDPRRLPTRANPTTSTSASKYSGQATSTAGSRKCARSSMPIPTTRRRGSGLRVPSTSAAAKPKAKGAREQALMLYEQAAALRGKPLPEWNDAGAEAAQDAIRRLLRQRYAGLPHGHGIGDQAVGNEPALRSAESQGRGEAAGGKTRRRQAEAHPAGEQDEVAASVSWPRRTSRSSSS